MPWRAEGGQTANPYHVLVSEAMLQQTQVATVVPYFHRFIQALPSVEALANADEQQVLTLWQGLGYYRRARHLHAAAKTIVSEHGGKVPACVEGLLALPGIGPYTAGAIASIAYGTRAAVVDGNVERVLARLLLITDPINAPATKKKVWTIADSLVPKSSPGDYNQAVMELGAMVCTPRAPKCFVCPLRGICRGVQETNPETLPVKLAKKKPMAVTHVVIAAHRNGRYLFEQRPEDGLWSNMWQLPTLEATNPTEHGIITSWFKQRFQLVLKDVQSHTSFTHQTTHRTIRFEMFHSTICSGRLRANTGIWRRPDQLDDLPMSNPQRKAIAALD